jgi:transposase
LNRLGAGEGFDNLSAGIISRDETGKPGVGVGVPGAVMDGNKPAGAGNKRGHFAGCGVEVRRSAGGYFDGVGKALCADTGRPPYDPADLLKLYLYGYLHRIRSSRLLEAECQRNVEVIWLLGKLTPDFKTIADFRKDNLKPLRAVNRQFTVLCRRLELFGGQLLAVDGSKFQAVNSRDQNFNAAKLQDLIERADARLAEYLEQLDSADAAEPGGSALTKDELAAKIAALQEKQDWHAELLAQLQEGEDKQVSVTDPDTRKMPTAHGMMVGYNAQMAVDAKHKLIAADDVTNEVTDYKQAVVWVHPLSAQGIGESTDGVEPDDAGLQPQTGAEPGKLREIDASSGSKSSAKRLNRGGRPFFLLLAMSSFRTAIRTNRISGKQKPAIRTFGPPVKLFLRPSLAPRRSFHTASRFVRPHGYPSQVSSCVSNGNDWR